MKSIPEKSDDTRRIEARLRDARIDEVVTYDELSRIIGRDVRNHCMNNIYSARRILMKENMHFGTVIGEGIKRLSPDDSVKSAQLCTKRAKNAARKGIKTLKHIEYSELSEEAKKVHLVESTKLVAMELFGSEKATKRIEGKIDKDTLPLGETLKLFVS